MNLKRVRALGWPSSHHLCMGCSYLRGSCTHPNAGGDTSQCTEVSTGSRRNYIFIPDTPEGHAAYTALVLEHGIEQDSDNR